MVSRSGPRPRRARNLLLLFVLLGLLLPPAGQQPVVYAATYDIADGDVAALLAAIHDVHGSSAVTVNLAPGGSYIVDQQVGTAPLSTITSASLTINGNGATIARGSAPGTPAFNFFSIGEGFLALNDLTLRNGSAPTGGAIESLACGLHLINVTFTGNHASGNGGALALDGCTVDMTTVTFSDNHASSNGGLGQLPREATRRRALAAFCTLWRRCMTLLASSELLQPGPAAHSNVEWVKPLNRPLSRAVTRHNGRRGGPTELSVHLRTSGWQQGPAPRQEWVGPRTSSLWTTTRPR